MEATPQLEVDCPLGIDIGGTMTKIVFFRPNSPPALPEYLVKESHLEGLPVQLNKHMLAELPNLSGVMRFIKIPSNRVPDFVDFLLNSGLINDFVNSRREVRITGGGAHKFQKLIEERLNVRVAKLDEMGMLVNGLNFFLQNKVYEEVFTFNARMEHRTYDLPESFFPYLLVNIGSGASILRVDGYNQYERVSGTSIGGGTFWGLARLLTKVESYNQVEKLSSEGHNANIDLLVADIYGGSYEQLGLGGRVIASSFGKVGSVHEDAEPADPSAYEEADMIRSLLFMVTNNITQIAYLNAEKHNVKRVFFAGGFIQRNQYIWSRLSYGINFWSKGAMEALFLKHDGYLGAIGTLTAQTPE